MVVDTRHDGMTKVEGDLSVQEPPIDPEFARALTALPKSLTTVSPELNDEFRGHVVSMTDEEIIGVGPFRVETVPGGGIELLITRSPASEAARSGNDDILDGRRGRCPQKEQNQYGRHVAG